eukprot:1215566-Prymnesium_polylepis.1
MVGRARRAAVPLLGRAGVEEVDGEQVHRLRVQREERAPPPEVEHRAVDALGVARQRARARAQQVGQLPQVPLRELGGRREEGTVDVGAVERRLRAEDVLPEPAHQLVLAQPDDALARLERRRLPLEALERHAEALLVDDL